MEVSRFLWSSKKKDTGVRLSDVLRISSHSFRCTVLIIISGDHRIDHSYFLSCLYEIKAGDASTHFRDLVYH
jgi:hypothetical protein